jgi:DNA modification methylase
MAVNSCLLFEENQTSESSVLSTERKDYGTFKDSMRAPIHRWFQYPAGYSYKFIEEKIKEYKLNSKHWVLDPFVGSGTTSVVAKNAGVNSIGIEAHPFVHEIACSKIYWEYDLSYLQNIISKTMIAAEHRISNGYLHKINLNSLPKLVKKCYSSANLKRLLLMRDIILELKERPEYKNFLKLVLTNVLRTAAKAGTGWPYIAPTKYHEKTIELDGIEEFKKYAHLFYKDLLYVRSRQYKKDIEYKIILGDAREYHPEILDESIDLAITSPPYLNNYDYADRTRLETYFWGKYSTWGEITRKVRDKLMIAATTQIRRPAFNNLPLDSSIYETSPDIFRELNNKIKTLASVRMKKGGRKSYDLMVAGYFNDMFKVMIEVYRVLKPNCDFVLVLGDLKGTINSIVSGPENSIAKKW